MKKTITKEKVISREKAIDKLIVKCGKVGMCEDCSASGICKGSTSFDFFSNDELRRIYNSMFDDYVSVV
jgi:hypothetical protein